MESQKTTHILLSITLALVFLLVIMVARQNAWQRQYLKSFLDYNQNVSVEEEEKDNQNNFQTPVENINTQNQTNNQNNTGGVTTNIGGTPTAQADKQEDLELVIGQLYKTAFNSGSGNVMKYCGIRPHTVPGKSVQNYLIFVKPGGVCNGDFSQDNLTGFKLDEFVVYLKSGIDSSVLTNINNQYKTVIKSSNSSYYVIGVGESGLNSYTLSDLYFKTGFFSLVKPVIGFEV